MDTYLCKGYHSDTTVMSYLFLVAVVGVREIYELRSTLCGVTGPVVGCDKRVLDGRRGTIDLPAHCAMSPIDRVLPLRRAAKQASIILAEQLGDTSGSDEEDHAPHRLKGSTAVTYGGKKRKKPRSFNKGGTLICPDSSSTAVREPVDSAPLSRPRPRPIFAKKKREPASPLPGAVEDDESSLTSLSSATPSPSPPPSPPVRLQPQPIVRAQPQPVPLVPTSSSTSSVRPRRLALREEDLWDIDALGDYVWVLIDRRARVYEPGGDNSPLKASTGWLWWPGKVNSRFTHMMWCYH